MSPFILPLAAIWDKSPKTWVFLPTDKNWNLGSDSAILESDEVPPGLENEPDAGVPDFAKRNNLMRVLPVTALQDIVSNATDQNPNATLGDLFRAFEHYYKHDAFIDFGLVGPEMPK